jgi:hypothetical protein
MLLGRLRKSEGTPMSYGRLLLLGLALVLAAERIAAIRPALLLAREGGQVSPIGAIRAS